MIGVRGKWGCRLAVLVLFCLPQAGAAELQDFEEEALKRIERVKTMKERGLSPSERAIRIGQEYLAVARLCEVSAEPAYIPACAEAPEGDVECQRQRSCYERVPLYAGEGAEALLAAYALGDRSFFLSEGLALSTDMMFTAESFPAPETLARGQRILEALHGLETEEGPPEQSFRRSVNWLRTAIAVAKDQPEKEREALYARAQTVAEALDRRLQDAPALTGNPAAFLVIWFAGTVEEASRSHDPALRKSRFERAGRIVGLLDERALTFDNAADFSAFLEYYAMLSIAQAADAESEEERAALLAQAEKLAMQPNVSSGLLMAEAAE